MAENKENAKEIFPNDLLKLNFEIKEFEKDDKKYYLVGFSKNDNDSPSMFMLESLEQIPMAMYTWGEILLTDYLGWTPPEQSQIIVPEKSKLILPK